MGCAVVFNSTNIWLLFCGLVGFIISLIFSIIILSYSINYLNVIKKMGSYKGLSIKICIGLNILSIAFTLFSLFIFLLDKLLQIFNF